MNRHEVYCVLKSEMHKKEGVMNVGRRKKVIYECCLKYEPTPNMAKQCLCKAQPYTMVVVEVVVKQWWTCWGC